MQKVVALELVIVSATLTAALLLLFMFNGVTIEEHNQVITMDNSTKSITFDLKAGQHVSGTLNYTQYHNDITYFFIFPPTGKDYIKNADYTFGNHTGSFAFTATMDGNYFLAMSKDGFFSDSLDYKYTVSPAILGLDKTELIAIVIAVGAFLAAVTTLSHLRKLKKRNTAQK